jgi:tetratricopeptide (TPR) repeat protein
MSSRSVRRVVGIAWFAVAAAAPLPVAARGGTPTGLHASALEAEIDRRIHAAMDALYASRLSEAQRIADEIVTEAPEDPRVHIVAARVHRETFPEQNSSDARLDRLAAPIQTALDRAIAAADHMIEVDERSVPGHLYRGWARMFRAQMHTLCGEYWSAGRQAKAGKDDLDRALGADPGNPDASSVLGTYLYFADALPGIVKIARRLVRVPGGDRERGLALLRGAAGEDGYNRLDARALLGVIAFGFDGDFDAAWRDFDAALRDCPDNPRLLEPLAVLNVLRPRRDYGARISSAAARHAESVEPWNRQLAQRLRFYDALAEMLDGGFDSARSRLEAVRRAAPARPDWFAPDVMLCAGELALLLGEREPALAVYATAAQAHGERDDAHDNEYEHLVEERMRFLKDPEAVAPEAEAVALRKLTPIAQALAAGDLDAAGHGLALLPDDLSPAAHFYRGEWARLSGRYDDAAANFARVTEAPLPARWRFFKIIAFARRAESLYERGDPRAAARVLERALEFDTDRDLMRHVLRARRRFFEAQTGRRRAEDPATLPPSVAR